MEDKKNYLIGANILDNLTTGMYTDSRIIFREYIQNACDSIDQAYKEGILAPKTGAVEIYTDTIERSIVIHDNGMGIKADEFDRTLGNIADSDKTLGETKGFRGIGRLCGLAYCKTLVFSAKAKGENTISHMRFDAEKMRHLVNQNQSRTDVKYSAVDVLTAIITRDSEPSKDIEDHWFEVKLVSVNEENHELLHKMSVIDYLSFVAPVPFGKNFSYRSIIYEYIKKNGLKLDEYTIKVDGDQIFKDYKTHISTGKGEDHIFDVQFKELRDDRDELIAWVWYGLRNFQYVIKADDPQRGLRLRKENIQIGNEDALQRLFREDRGTHYFIGEVHAVSRDLIPNSQRDYFNENNIRNVFEREASQYFGETLHRLYHAGNDVSSAIDKIEKYKNQEKEYKKKEKNGDFIDTRQRQEAEEKVKKAKRTADEAKKKIIATTDKYHGDEESPINKVVTRIVEQRKADRYLADNDEGKKGGQDDTPDKPNDQTNGSTNKKMKKHWVDRLSAVNSKERKLISRVCGVIRECVDEKTMEIIQQKLEEEFK